MKACVLVIAANHDGDFDIPNVRFASVMPYITADSSNLKMPAQNVYEGYINYIEYLTTLKAELPDIIVDIREKQAKIT